MTTLPSKRELHMPRYDAHHETVKTALRKDGWTITDDPFTIYVGKTRLYADLGAEKEARLIVVEIKGFEGESFVNELHRATGQYANYRSLLRGAPQSYEIYLAIPHDVYSKYFHRELVTTIIKDQQIKFFTYDPQTEEVVLWNS